MAQEELVSHGFCHARLLSGAYATTDFRERRVLWGHLSTIITQGLPSLIAGDFNCILGAHEKKGGRQYTEKLEIREFRSFIDTLDPIDLGFSGPKFTWCNNHHESARVSERIDRALASTRWIHHFPDFSVWHLPRIASDHCRILISTNTVIRYRSPFRFEQFWTHYSSVWELISQVLRLPVRGGPIYRISRRLELAKRRLLWWNKHEVGDIFRLLEQTEEHIVTMQLRKDQEGSL